MAVIHPIVGMFILVGEKAMFNVAIGSLVDTICLLKTEGVKEGNK